MAEHSEIEWTDATWNPVTGCSVVSPGCKNCYAMKLAGTRLQHHASRAGLTRDSKAGPVWTGEVRLNEDWLDQPLRWKRPRRIFVCAHGDLFHESVPDDWIDRVFAVMALAPHHTFQVLTKRPERMADYFGRGQGRDGATDFSDAERRIEIEADRIRGGWSAIKIGVLPIKNVWLGVSVEDQARADERIPHLLATPAAVRFVSAEPLLGALDLRPWLPGDDGCGGCDDGAAGGPSACTQPDQPRDAQCPRLREVIKTTEGPVAADGAPAWVHCDKVTLDWVIVGGETGSGARPMHPDWARSLRDQCAVAQVPFFFKQWGRYVVTYDRDQDDPDWRRCPQHGVRNGRYLNLAGGHGFHGDRVVYVEPRRKTPAGAVLDGREWREMPQ